MSNLKYYVESITPHIHIQNYLGGQGRPYVIITFMILNEEDTRRKSELYQQLKGKTALSNEYRSINGQVERHVIPKEKWHTDEVDWAKIFDGIPEYAVPEDEFFNIRRWQKNPFSPPAD